METDSINPIRYRGYYYDTETGFYSINSRYYDPRTGRFLNADELSYLGADGELRGYNLYTYCGNNPVMKIDPTGTIFKEWAWILSGVLIVGGWIGGAAVAAGAGSLVGGYLNEASGGSFEAGYDILSYLLGLVS